MKKTFLKIIQTNIFFFLSVLLMGSLSFSASNNGLVYHGRILKPDGSSVNSGNVTYTVRIYGNSSVYWDGAAIQTGSDRCLLYQEKFTKNMSNTYGTFELLIGEGVAIDGANPRFPAAAAVSEQTVSNIFKNYPYTTTPTTAGFKIPAHTCSAGTGGNYIPFGSPASISAMQWTDRELQVTVDTGSVAFTLAAVPLRAQPWALQAAQLNGFSTYNFFKINGSSDKQFDVTQHDFLYDLSGLGMTVGSGALNANGHTITGLPTPVSTTDAATKAYVDSMGAGSGISQLSGDVIALGPGSVSAALSTTGVVAATYGSASQVAQMTVDAKGRITGATSVNIDGYALTALNPASISGIVPIAKGGTALSTTPTNGQLLIGNGTGYTLAGLTAGSGIAITSGAGSIVITASGATSLANGGTGLTAGGTSNQLLGMNAAGSALEYKSIIAGAGVSITSSAGTMTITASGSGGTITGSGTTNYLPVFATATSLANSPLYVSGGFVGIGTTNPGFKLDVTGDVSINTGNLYALTGSLLSPNIYGGTAATQGLVIDSNTSGAKGSIILNPIAGNVGIGTYSPTTQLEMTGALTTRGMASPTISSGGTGRIYFDSTANKYKVSQNGGAFVDLVGGASSAVSGTLNYMPVFTSAGTAIGNSPVYVSGGNIGIGTTSPLADFHIQSSNSYASLMIRSTNASGGNGQAAIDLESYNVANGYAPALNLTSRQGAFGSVTAIQDSDVLGTINFWGSGSSTVDGQAAEIRSEASAAWTSASTPGLLKFKTTPSGAITPQTRMVIDSAGNMGIGISSPAAKLDVGGVLNINSGTTTAGTYVLNFSNGSNLSTASAAGGIKGEVNNTGSGNVDGISMSAATGYAGTTSTVNGLSVGIRNYAGNTITSGRAIIANSPSVAGALTTATGVYIAQQKTAGVSIGYGIYQADSGDTNYFAGNLGIGTASPGTQLDMTGAFTLRGMAAPTVSSGGSGRIYFDSTANKYKVSQNGGGFVDLVGGASSSVSGTLNYMPVFTSAGTALGNSPVYVSGTNLGIGTANPNATLDINGQIRTISGTSGGLSFPALSAGSMGIYSNVGSNDISLAPYYDVLFAPTNAGGRFRPSNDNASGLGTPGQRWNNLQVGTGDSSFAGQVGLGSTSPTSQLEMTGALTTRGMSAPSTSSGGTGRIYFDSTANKYKVSQNGGGYVDLVGGASSSSVSGTLNYMPVFTSGGTALGDSPIYVSGTSIGIGTTGPSYPLTVSGSGTGPTVGVTNVTPTGYADLAYFGNGRSFITGVGGASEATYGVNNKYFIFDNTANAVRMVVDTSGNVGIGNSSPGALLSVGTAGTSMGAIRLAGLTSGYMQIQPASAAGNWTMTLPATGGSVGQVLQVSGASGATTWATVPVNGGTFLAGAGSSGAPSFSFSSDTNTGIYSYQADEVDIVTAGVDKAAFGPSQIQFYLAAQGNSGTAVNPGWSFVSDTGTGMFNPAPAGSNILAFTTGGNERMRIAATGQVSIGTTSTAHPLNVSGTAGLSTGTAWTNTSDIRLKDVHGDYEYGLNEILKLHTVRFNYKKDNPLGLASDVPMTGFIAQEVKKVIPDAVKTRPDGYLELNVDPIHWATVNAVKDLYGMCKVSDAQLNKIARDVASLQQENEDLRKENALRIQEMAELKARLDKIEKLLRSK